MQSSPLAAIGLVIFGALATFGT